MTPEDRKRFRSLLTDAQAEALTAYGEARGESVLGLTAVICVIRNRAKVKQSHSVDEALRTAAFECWLDEEGANDSVVAELAQMLVLKSDRPVNPTFDVCLYLAVRESLPDPTGGATHYYSPSAMGKTPTPMWVRPPAKLTVTIGHHLFFTHVAF